MLQLNLIYLAIVRKVGFEDVFNVGRITCVDAVMKWSDHTESWVLASGGCKVVVEGVEVHDYIKQGTSYRGSMHFTDQFLHVGEEEGDRKA